MKLYATITSERATKGQGGNNYLNIVITCGDNRKVLANIEVKKEEANMIFYRAYCNDEKIAELIEYPALKGKRQKDKIGLNSKTYSQILEDWESRK